MVSRKQFISLTLTAILTTLSYKPAVATDTLIWDQLRGTNPKGYVLLMRHSLAPGVGDPENFQLGDCKTQRNLSAEGRLDAKDVGEWLKRQQITIFRVESSRWCRAKETAQLLGLGRVKLNKNLDSLFQESDLVKHPQTLSILNQISEHRKRTGLLILVGHYVNIAALTGVGVDSGEGVLVRANRKGIIKIHGFTPDLGR